MKKSELKQIIKEELSIDNDKVKKAWKETIKLINVQSKDLNTSEKIAFHDKIRMWVN